MSSVVETEFPYDVAFGRIQPLPAILTEPVIGVAQLEDSSPMGLNMPPPGHLARAHQA